MKKIALIILMLAMSPAATLRADYTTPSESITLCGEASWYSETDPGVLETTANMEAFNEKELTCAIWDMPFGTLLKVTNLDNGKSVVVRVNDRGPAKRLVKMGRVIDLTKRAFSEIAPLKEGLIRVSVVIVE